MELKEIVEGLAIEIESSNFLSEEEESDQEERNLKSGTRSFKKTSLFVTSME